MLKNQYSIDLRWKVLYRIGAKILLHILCIKCFIHWKRIYFIYVSGFWLIFHIRPVWPDWAIFCTLGNHSKPVATIILPKLPTLLVNFRKGAKLFIFLVMSIFIWSHCSFLSLATEKGVEVHPKGVKLSKGEGASKTIVTIWVKKKKEWKKKNCLLNKTGHF